MKFLQTRELVAWIGLRFLVGVRDSCSAASRAGGANGGQQLQLAFEHRRWIQSRTLEALFLGLYGEVQVQSKLPRIDGGYR
jgi:hypothetical protein